MKPVNSNAALAFFLAGCCVMYKAQGLDAKNRKEVKVTGPEYKGKTS